MKRRPTPWPRFTGLLSAILVLVVSGHAAAQKSKPSNPPVVAAPGTIYFDLGGSLWRMNADGSNKTSLGVSVGVPSQQTYGGIRWWLERRSTPDVYDRVVYPDGTVTTNFPHRDLYAVGTIGGTIVAQVRLTDFYGGFLVHGHAGAADVAWWSNDGADSFITFGGTNLQGAVESENGETVLYVAQTSGMLCRLWISGSEISTSLVPATPSDGLLEHVLAYGTSEADRIWYGMSWSPDGNRLAATIGPNYENLSIWLLDVSDDGIPQTVADATCAYADDGSDWEDVSGPQWSPAGGNILFSHNGRKLLNPNNFTVTALSVPALCWSPDGQHLLGTEITWKGLKRSYQLVRHRLSDNARVVLTSDLDAQIAKSPRAWTW